MNANELMIGDWVRIKGHPCKVSYLAPFDIGDARLAVISNDYDGNPYLDEIEPIPLTEEILMANALKDITPDYEVQDGWIFGNSVGMIWDENHIDTGFFNLFYVHELQNFLRLCGLTDLADNFKVSPN